MRTTDAPLYYRTHGSRADHGRQLGVSIHGIEHRAISIRTPIVVQ